MLSDFARGENAGLRIAVQYLRNRALYMERIHRKSPKRDEMVALLRNCAVEIEALATTAEET